MSVIVQRWRLEIGTFSCRYILRYPQSWNFFMKGKTAVVGFAFSFLLNFFVILYFYYILLSHGDIKVNAGPKNNCCTSSCFVIGIYNYVKLSSLQAYTIVYKHNVICLSETHLDNSVLSDKSGMDFTGYKMVRVDCPENVKKRRSMHLF